MIHKANVWRTLFEVVLVLLIVVGYVQVRQQSDRLENQHMRLCNVTVNVAKVASQSLVPRQVAELEQALAQCVRRNEK